jgi:hypothetical protein
MSDTPDLRAYPVSQSGKTNSTVKWGLIVDGEPFNHIPNRVNGKKKMYNVRSKPKALAPIDRESAWDKVKDGWPVSHAHELNHLLGFCLWKWNYQPRLFNSLDDAMNERNKGNSNE